MLNTGTQQGSNIDYITCGLCQNEFLLSNMGPFLEHKVSGCTKQIIITDQSNSYLVCNIGDCSAKFCTSISLLIHIKLYHDVPIEIGRINQKEMNSPDQSADSPETTSSDTTTSAKSKCSCCAKKGPDKACIQKGSNEACDKEKGSNEARRSKSGGSCCGSEGSGNKETKRKKSDCSKGSPCPCEMNSMTTLSIGDSLEDVSKNAPCLSINKNRKCGDECDILRGDEINKSCDESRSEQLDDVPSDKSCCDRVDKPQNENELSVNDSVSENVSRPSEAPCICGIEVIDTSSQTLDFDKVEIVENKCNPENCSPEICRQRLCCDNDNCCTGITSSTGSGLETVRKCCSSVVPKKRKQHIEMTHLPKETNKQTISNEGVIASISNNIPISTVGANEPDTFLATVTDKSPNPTFWPSSVQKDIHNYPPHSMARFMDPVEDDNEFVHPNFINYGSLTPGNQVPVIGYADGANSYSLQTDFQSPGPSSFNQLDTSQQEMVDTDSQGDAGLSSPRIDSEDGDKKHGSRDSNGKRRYPTYRPFKCQICGSAFNQNIHLKKHLSRHTGEKPFKCTQCSYSTVEKSHLKVHMRIHTGEKPFKCKYCDYATAQNSTLTIHVKRRHKFQVE